MPRWDGYTSDPSLPRVRESPEARRQLGLEIVGVLRCFNLVRIHVERDRRPSVPELPGDANDVEPAPHEVRAERMPQVVAGERRKAGTVEPCCVRRLGEPTLGHVAVVERRALRGEDDVVLRPRAPKRERRLPMPLEQRGQVGLKPDLPAAPLRL
jgi:hypothetical protein